MGRSPRPKPKYLAKKLRYIRKHFGLKIERMVELLNTKQARVYPGHISEYERGRREPPLPVLLRYARIVRLPMEILVDDELELPRDFNLEAYRELDEWIKRWERSEREEIKRSKGPK